MTNSIIHIAATHGCFALVMLAIYVIVQINKPSTDRSHAVGNDAKFVR
jgi:hypothetical protein